MHPSTESYMQLQSSRCAAHLTGVGLSEFKELCEEEETMFSKCWKDPVFKVEERGLLS